MNSQLGLRFFTAGISAIIFGMSMAVAIVAYGSGAAFLGVFFFGSGALLSAAMIIRE